MIKNWILNCWNNWVARLANFLRICGVLWAMPFEDSHKILQFIVKWYIIIPTYHTWDDAPMFIIQNVVIITVLLTLWYVGDRERFRLVLLIVVCAYLSIYVPGFVYIFVWAGLVFFWETGDRKGFCWFLINSILYLLVFSFPTPPWV